jgi:hypothetical protein
MKEVADCKNVRCGKLQNNIAEVLITCSLTSSWYQPCIDDTYVLFAICIRYHRLWQFVNTSPFVDGFNICTLHRPQPPSEGGIFVLKYVRVLCLVILVVLCTLCCAFGGLYKRRQRSAMHGVDHPLFCPHSIYIYVCVCVCVCVCHMTHRINCKRFPRNIKKLIFVIKTHSSLWGTNCILTYQLEELLSSNGWRTCFCSPLCPSPQQACRRYYSTLNTLRYLW